MRTIYKIVLYVKPNHTDKRVNTTAAMLHAIKFCKLNHYEEKLLSRIHDARKKDMIWVHKELAYFGATMAITVMTPLMATAITYITFAFMNDCNILSESDVFTASVLFTVLRFPINYAGKLIRKAAQGWKLHKTLPFLNKRCYSKRILSCWRK